MHAIVYAYVPVSAFVCACMRVCDACICRPLQAPQALTRWGAINNLSLCYHYTPQLPTEKASPSGPKLCSTTDYISINCCLCPSHPKPSTTCTPSPGLPAHVKEVHLSVGVPSAGGVGTHEACLGAKKLPHHLLVLLVVLAKMVIQGRCPLQPVQDGCVCQNKKNNNKRLFMVPPLLRARIECLQRHNDAHFITYRRTHVHAYAHAHAHTHAYMYTKAVTLAYTFAHRYIHVINKVSK